jgi:5'-3' exonuclease
MGVPGFFGWLLRQYKDNKMMISNVNDITHLYVDANCLLHPQCFKILEHCSDTYTKKKLESLMMKRICNYVTYIFNHVKPTEEFYFSIDGVAPDAKMNQQRKRRIRANDDKDIKNKIKEKHNVPISKHDWSNTTITPGTEFMERLHEHLDEYFKILKKNNTNVKIIYSSYHTEGEGEHKIMNDIRNNLKKESFQNKNIAIYGLDADLIFLSMACNKQNMFLLRESHQLSKNNIQEPIIDPVIDVAEQLTYVSIDITKKCYFEQIHNIIKQKQKEKNLNKNNINVNKTKINNDFIVLCYLLGNDFLPHIPSIDIKRYGLDILLDAYLDTYLHFNCVNYLVNDDFSVDKLFLINMLSELSRVETKYFKVIKPKSDDRFSRNTCRSNEPYDIEVWNVDNLKCFQINDTIKLGEGYKSDEWKFRYYEHYFNSSSCESQTELINDMCKEYILGIMWVTEYYFKGCDNWSWQYPYSHAPFMSDISKYIESHDINFVKPNYSSYRNKSVQPFAQLLCVLPSFCANELPKSLSLLMTSNNSPMIDLYPTKIKLDMLYKDQYWQCLPHIPELDVERVLLEMTKIKITDKKENKRNLIMNDLIY